ncbi:carbohydrate ABC transporter membrane protein 2, CUT1 family (TC 3.A.1.1.-) [Paenibacillus uliginis N3/975]|uniref:Carbohydrate ABC transporter membrane protein 2, CUT1 family (TC 3.A.1.1.-) n=1 Tax=Paenibacillus uliginis N3/975 TaxID=1313296 RepID=A0A1X7HB45_9BACL|nr:carbohydrate ABC transporter permease [Paenibacillus uliginis]SMF83142.1 carbohydrate ABC transporter membrane protein 2, CUT1 family (TC 3.A.1.1.-) [Paenibacillus uliginis N3/975]
MVKQSRGDRIFDIINLLLLGSVLIIVLYPLVFVAVASISDPAAVVNGEVWLIPKDITFAGYEKVFSNKEILRGYMNTIIYTVVGTIVNIIMTILAAYPLSRKDLRGRNLITAMFVFTMFFSGGLIPTYLIVKQLGMVNTMWALIIPNAVAIWNIIIMRTFFQQSIPIEVQESAQIDGCNNIKILLKIVLPLSLPVLAVMTLFYSVTHWNSFFNALIYLTEREKYPLQLILREILIQSNMQDMIQTSEESLAKSVMEAESIKYAVVIIANLPVLMLYPFLQRYFVKGMVIGAIKG